MDQAGFVGGLLTDPLVVRAHDQDGQPISGIQVAWTATGGGVATPAAGVTDADGLTSTSYRLGDAVGTQTITAIINGDDQGVTFTATATPAPASMITVTAGDDQTGVVKTQLPTDLTVKVTDAFGNAKAGTTVFFTVVLPLSRSGIVAGLGLGFARALGEFGVTLMIAGNIQGHTQTGALAIYDAVQADQEARAAGMVAVLTVVAVLALYAGTKLTRGRPHAW